MSVIEQLFTENPMLIEVRRLHRRFFGLERANAMNAVVLVLAGMAYLALLMIVWYYRADVDPIALIYLQTFLFLLVGPAMLHGTIAGEREKRSWDLLLVAPLTKAQIIVGKFVGALSALGAGALLFLLPIAIAAVSYNPSWSGGERGAGMRLYDLALLEGVSLSFLVLVCATAVLISARCKRSFMALGTTIGVLMMALVVIPLLIATGLGYDRMQVEFSLGLHPFFVLTKIHDLMAGDRPYQATSSIPNWFYGVPQIVTYTLFTIVLLVWAERTLRFADGEANFIPRKNHA